MPSSKFAYVVAIAIATIASPTTQEPGALDRARIDRLVADGEIGEALDIAEMATRAPDANGDAWLALAMLRELAERPPGGHEPCATYRACVAHGSADAVARCAPIASRCH